MRLILVPAVGREEKGGKITMTNDLTLTLHKPLAGRGHTFTGLPTQGDYWHFRLCSAEADRYPTSGEPLGEEFKRTATARKGLAGRHREGIPPALMVFCNATVRFMINDLMT